MEEVNKFIQEMEQENRRQRMRRERLDSVRMLSSFVLGFFICYLLLT